MSFTNFAKAQERNDYSRPKHYSLLASVGDFFKSLFFSSHKEKDGSQSDEIIPINPQSSSRSSSSPSVIPAQAGIQAVSNSSPSATYNSFEPEGSHDLNGLPPKTYNLAPSVTKKEVLDLIKQSDDRNIALIRAVLTAPKSQTNSDSLSVQQSIANLSRRISVMQENNVRQLDHTYNSISRSFDDITSLDGVTMTNSSFSGTTGTFTGAFTGATGTFSGNFTVSGNSYLNTTFLTSKATSSLSSDGSLENITNSLRFTGNGYRTNLTKRVSAHVASSSVATWTTRTSTKDVQWFGVTWSPELGLFAAVAYTGTGNQVMTSPDGINWTGRTTPADNGWFSVAWSPELSLFAAVGVSGTGNRVMTSPDGINWTLRTSASDVGWVRITWSSELGLFVAVANTNGTGNRIMTSPDGINWTGRTSVADDIGMRGISWSPELGLLVAVSDTGTGDRIITSPDGINWTSRTTPANNSWSDVVWSPELGLFAAVAYTGTGNRVMTSPDGINWTLRTSASDAAWRSIAWSPELGLFAATGNGGVMTERVMTSPDGINWTTRATPPIDTNWRGIVWSPELGIFVLTTSGSQAVVATSKPFDDKRQYLSLYGRSETQIVSGTTTFSGLVGIGTTSPYSKLSVWGGGTGTNKNFEITNRASTTLMSMLDNGTGYFLGNVGIGTTSPWRTLSVTGSMAVTALTAGAAGDYAVCINNTTKELTNAGASGCVVSSKRFKENISALDSGLDELMKLKPSKFTYIGQTGEHIGLIAEDVNEIDKRLVEYEADGITPRTVRYLELSALLIKSIQELNLKIGNLEASTTAQRATSDVAQDGLFSWVVNKFMTTLGITFGQDKVRAKNLCATKSDGSEVCVDGDQLQVLLDKNGITQISSSSSSSIISSGGGGQTGSSSSSQISNSSSAGEAGSSDVGTSSPSSSSSDSAISQSSSSSPSSSEASSFSSEISSSSSSDEYSSDSSSSESSISSEIISSSSSQEEDLSSISSS